MGRQRGARQRDRACGHADTLAAPILEDARTRAAALARIPMGRFGRPEDLIAATVFLLSPGSAFMTGQVLYVDGGRTIG